MPVPVRERNAVAGEGRRVTLGRLVTRGLTIALSLVSAVAGAALLGYFARETGHPTVDVAKIACLGAIAGASVGAAVIPLIRALAWSVVATSIAAVGAGALWFVHRLDPLLLRSIFDRLW